MQIASILKAIGPGASIIFAAWIFMGYVQQRYDAAMDRYRQMVGSYRAEQHAHNRRANLEAQIRIVKGRCELMHYANLIGLVSAMAFVFSLIVATFELIFDKLHVLDYVSVAAMVLGFGGILIAACFVVVESLQVRKAIDAELLDLEDLADATGQAAGRI